MKEIAHTPGPWHYQLAQVPDYGTGTRKEVPEVHDAHGDAIQMSEANARLIAAAPDLLGALECLLIGACAVGVPHAGERAVLQDAVNIARAAIAKAAP